MPTVHHHHIDHFTSFTVHVKKYVLIYLAGPRNNTCVNTSLNDYTSVLLGLQNYINCTRKIPCHSTASDTQRVRLAAYKYIRRTPRLIDLRFIDYRICYFLDKKPALQCCLTSFLGLPPKLTIHHLQVLVPISLNKPPESAGVLEKK